MNWFPDRKIIAGGIVGIAGWALTLVLARFNISMTPDQQTLFIGILGWLAAYLVPPSEQDVIKRMNDKLVQIAAADPSIPVAPTTRK